MLPRPASAVCSASSSPASCPRGAEAASSTGAKNNMLRPGEVVGNCETVRKNMISYGIIWFYMVLYGFIWFYIVLYGFIWFYIWVPMAMRVPNSWMVVENPNLEWMITRGTPILGNPHVGKWWLNQQIMWNFQRFEPQKHKGLWGRPSRRGVKGHIVAMICWTIAPKKVVGLFKRWMNVVEFFFTGQWWAVYRSKTLPHCRGPKHRALPNFRWFLVVGFCWTSQQGGPWVGYVFDPFFSFDSDWDLPDWIAKFNDFDTENFPKLW